MTRPLAGTAILTLLCLLFLPSIAPPALTQPDQGHEIATSRQIHIGTSQIQVDFATGATDLPTDTLLAHVQSAASAVTSYFGRFPVDRARILIIPVPGKSGILQGTTWGDMSGFQVFTRIRIGQHTTTADLADDWTTTHELVHLAFPSLPREQHWMEEGLATYLEPIARVETGELTAKKIWADMVHDMHKGEPAADDQGLDHTHTWGRTYWGGALFCLVADVEIHRETKNRKGLRDALRAIVTNGGTIDHEWSLPKALEIGDRATGTHVLTDMYAKWKDTPTPVDLDKLWSDLGIHSTPNGLEFTADAQLSKAREAIASDPHLPNSATSLRP